MQTDHHLFELTTGPPQLHQLLIISTGCLSSIIKVAQEDFLALIPKLAPPALGFAVPKHASVTHECTTSGDCSASRRERLDSFHTNGFTSPIPTKAHLYWRFNASRSASDRSDGFTGSSSLRAIQNDGTALIGRCCWLACQKLWTVLHTHYKPLKLSRPCPKLLCLWAASTG